MTDVHDDDGFTLWRPDDTDQGPVADLTDRAADGHYIVSRLWRYDTIAAPDLVDEPRLVPDDGATYGYVQAGAVTVWDPANRADGVLLRAERWFALPGGARLHLHPDTRLVAAQRVGYRGVRSFGGPIENAGRLRYIDGCTDTLLACPPLLGDPCLNHLHFPPSIAQTMHTHPSVRAGAIARGAGWCETPTRVVALDAGAVWLIEANSPHRFITDADAMDVVAYHPDSDWGPTDQAHPMLNRTWVDGATIDNTGRAHDPRDLIR